MAGREPFQLRADVEPSGDQPGAIAALVEGLEADRRCQVLLGVTGSGKTFTVANVIAAINKNTSAVYFPFTVQGGGNATVASWVTTASQTLAAAGSPTMTNGQFGAQLEARSIRTFVIN